MLPSSGIGEYIEVLHRSRELALNKYRLSGVLPFFIGKHLSFFSRFALHTFSLPQTTCSRLVWPHSTSRYRFSPERLFRYCLFFFTAHNVPLLLSLQAPEGEGQPSTEVDLFISTEKIMVLNTDLKVMEKCDKPLMSSQPFVSTPCSPLPMQYSSGLPSRGLKVAFNFEDLADFHRLPPPIVK